MDSKCEEMRAEYESMAQQHGDAGGGGGSNNSSNVGLVVEGGALAVMLNKQHQVGAAAYECVGTKSRTGLSAVNPQGVQCTAFLCW